MLPPLKTCLQESDFHSQIYYSKKSVSKMFYTSMRLVLCTTDYVVITSFIGPKLYISGLGMRLMLYPPLPPQCTEEVQRALRSPTEIGTHPPKLQTTHELNYSGRTGNRRRTK